jgi:hypothetical protein
MDSYGRHDRYVGNDRYNVGGIAGQLSLNPRTALDFAGRRNLKKMASASSFLVPVVPDVPVVPVVLTVTYVH